MKFKIFVLICIGIYLSNYCYAFEDTPAVEPKEETVPVPISGTFDVTTNYMSEGLSNSANKPAIQGGLTYTFAKTGIYLNAWGTNVDFLDLREEHATVELDAIAGVANDINDNWSYDIYIDRYIYPGASNGDYTDLIASLTYKFFTATGYYSRHVFGSPGTGIYLNGAINYEIPEKIIYFSNISALASIGHYSLPASTEVHSYYDFMLGIQKKIKAFTLSLQWTDTAQCNLPPFDGSHVIGTILFDF